MTPSEKAEAAAADDQPPEETILSAETLADKRGSCDAPSHVSLGRKSSLLHKLSVALAGGAHAQQQQPQQLIRPTLKRYLILLLFCLNSGNKAFQWIQVPSATTKATLLYGVDNYTINCASILFMVAFLVLSWPACYIIETVGIRRAILVASFGTSVGAIVKCFSCHEAGVWLLMAGSIIVSLSEQLIFSVPSRLASVWFPDHQVSVAVAMCVVGNQVGVALGFLVPHWYLRDAETRADIGAGFQSMFVATAVYSVVVFFVCVLAFDEEPEMAPGAARLKQRQLEQLQARCQLDAHHARPYDACACEHGTSASASATTTTTTTTPHLAEMGRKLAHLFKQIFGLCRNGQLMLMAASYGIVVGINYTIQTLLDQMVGPAWPALEDELLVGETGFVIIVAGILTTPLWGRAMDRWHAYKLINVTIALGNVLSLAAFGYALVYLHSKLALQLTAAAYGLFSVGYCVSALEYAVELTYPAPELVTSSIMNVVPQLAGTIFILLGSHLVDTYGNLVASAFNVLMLLLGLALAMGTRERLRRQEAIQQMSDQKAPAHAIHF